MIQYKNKKYYLKYNLKRVQMIENAIKKPIMEVMRSGNLSIQELIAIVGFGMVPEHGNYSINPKNGFKIAEDILNTQKGSYLTLSDEVAVALERDCPFFFPAA